MFSMDLESEVESASAIFADEVTHSQDRYGNTLLNVFVDRKLVLTFVIKGDYPSCPPEVQLSVHYNCPDLEIVITELARELINSPMLFQLIEATRDWVKDGQHEVKEISPTTHVASSSSATKTCRFFKEGKCKFGDKCKFIHVEKGFSPSANGREMTSDTNEKFTTASALPPTTDVKTKENLTKPQNAGDEAEPGKKTSMRQAADVISRILWDEGLVTEHFCIGYLDRFVGIIEKPFAAFSWEDIASVGPTVLAVPQHRIQYFKYKNQIVWDKNSQLDNFFGSRGNCTIHDIIARSPTEPQRDTVRNESEPVISEDLVFQGDDKSPPKTSDDPNRPTHFLCIRITDQKTVSNIVKVQNHITDLSPQLVDGCSPPTAFHVTLCMVRLVKEEHIATAKATLEKIAPQFLQLLPRCVKLTLKGVDSFRDRLVFVKVTPIAALSKLVSFLIERLQLVGLSTPGNHLEYTPHVTILKLSRPMQHELSSKIISPAIYAPFQDSPIGQQEIKSLHLCSMTSPKQDDGFYLKLHTLTNSLTHLVPELSAPLICRVNAMFNQGTISENEKAKLTEIFSILDGKSVDEKVFEQALKVLTNRRLNQTEGSGNSTHVIILRGIPGSGKSFIARNSHEFASDPSKFAICSADDFFLNEDTYRFAAEHVPDAHTHCLRLFLKALYEKEVVIVDNTNSQLWEYEIYCYLCEILSLDMHIIEMPCPSDFIAEKYSARNVHKVDHIAISTTLRKWMKDDRAILVTPRISYPVYPASNNLFSLSAITQPDSYLAHQLQDLSSLFAVYTGIFLTAESQWLLVSTYTPAFSNVFADHVTLSFKPTSESIATTHIGKKVKVLVTGHVTESGIQAVRIKVPTGVYVDIDHPHITISTDKSVSPKASGAVLSKLQSKPSIKTIALEGTIGLVVRELMDSDKSPSSTNEREQLVRLEATKVPMHTITSRNLFQRNVVSKLYPKIKYGPNLATQDLVRKVTILTGEAKITNLYIFDFDGTLFNTPVPEKGKLMYKKHTGKEWPHKGWWSCPESLLPPLAVLPGPSIADFRSHVGQAESFTVILTSRIQRTELPLRAILDHASIYPDRLILKPDKSKQVPGYVFKGEIVKDLLRELPDVTKIRFWDDMQNNLSEVYRIAKLTKETLQVDLINVELPNVSANGSHFKEDTSGSFLEANLTSYAFLPNSTYLEAAKTGIDFLSSQFAKVVDFHGDPNMLSFPFGSFPLGRRSDVDLCFLAPPIMSPIELVEKLATQLEKCGLKYLHVAHCSRCPRLKARIEFNCTTSIDYDIVFAIFEDTKEQFNQTLSQHLSVLEVQSKLKAGDSTSKVALSGPLFLHHVQEAIKGSVSSSMFAAVVEMTVQVFGARNQKGNAFHCIRTFHIIQLLADFVRSQSSTLPPAHEPWNADQLFKEFVISSSKLPASKWSKLFGKFVPHQYIPEVTDTFAFMRACVNEHLPSDHLYHTMRSNLPHPPADYVTVKIRSSCDDKVFLWKMFSVIDARLPSYTRKILESGLRVVPCRVTIDESTSIFQFSVPDTDNTVQTVQQIFRPFWNEVAEYREKPGASIELLFVSTAQRTEATGVIQEQLKSFCKSDMKELHLPPSLNAYERLLVHESAERMNLEHKTIARGENTHIVLRK